VTDDQRRTVRDGYDDIAETYDAQRSRDPETITPVADLREAVGEDCRLLDLGCGGGRGPLAAFPRADAVGIDFSRVQLDIARERVDADLCVADMTSLPFVDDSFDAVTAFYSIIHVPIDEHRQVYEEVRRVLRPDGQFVFNVGDDWSGGEDGWLDTDTRMEWSFPSLDETVATLEAAGLSVVEEYAVWSEMDDTEWPFFRCRPVK
jgi:ubiquinone/menaquinone biosynthesis C-methylase UbiE